MDKPRVLIVDDEKGLRLGTKRLLEKEGYIVDTAEDGMEGIKLGTSVNYDLAIIDLRMPGIDGMEVLKEIQKAYPSTICFIATAYASYETAIESTKLGAFSYIPKPFSPDELIQQLKKGYEKRLYLLETERWEKEREERLLEVAFEKTRLNTIINSITDGILVVNRMGEAVLYNPGALKFLNIQKIEIEENIIPKLHPEIVKLITVFLDAGVYEQKSYSTQLEITQGTLFIEATSSAVPHPDGSLAGVVVVLKNITELKRIEFLKSQFVSMVSHELKAPVAAVYGYLKLLADGTYNVTPEQQKNYLLRSLFRLDSLLKMVNDLLDISRMETGTVKREMRALNVSEIINGIVELFQLDIQKKKINVSIKADTNLPPIKADYDEVNRLFTNLISNAIKYNKDEGSITIQIYSSDNYLNIGIKDTGIGMKPEEKTKLFHEFFRAKNEYTEKVSGTGLGLSIVKRIIDSYSAKIEVETEYRQGTEFKIQWPLL